jgi:hypothetical protein
LSTRSRALHPYLSAYALFADCGLIRRYPGSCDSLVVNGWNALYRGLRHWTGTGTVARADKQDQFTFPASYELIAALVMGYVGRRWPPSAIHARVKPVNAAARTTCRARLRQAPRIPATSGESTLAQARVASLGDLKIRARVRALTSVWLPGCR